MGDLSTNIYVLEDERKLLRDQRVIILSGDVDSGMAHEFLEDVEILVSQSLDPIRVLIESDGGQVDAGIACMRAIRSAQERGVRFVGEVYGHAMSMAFFILQVCDYRIMGDFCVIMAHGITHYSRGDIKNLDAETKLLKFWHLKFGELIATRCKEGTEYSDIDFWLPVMTDNTPQYYTSDEALEMGLIDEVTNFRI